MKTLTTRAWTGLLFAGLMSMGCTGPNMFSKANNSQPPVPTKTSVASNSTQTGTTKNAQQLPANPPGLPNMPGAQLTSANQMPPAGSGLSIPGSPSTVQPVNYNAAPPNGSSPYGNATGTTGTRIPDSVTRNSMPMPTPALPPMPNVPALPQPLPPSMDMPPAPPPTPAMGMPPPTAMSPANGMPAPVSPPLPVAPPPPVQLPAIKARPAE
jgi:hypothetical protein